MPKPIPKFKNEDEERAFWAENDSTNHLDWGKAEKVVFLKKPNMKMFGMVALKVGIEEAGLKAGDVGTVLEVYSDHAFEVEFLKTSGETQAVITLTSDQVRSL